MGLRPTHPLKVWSLQRYFRQEIRGIAVERPAVSGLSATPTPARATRSVLAPPWFGPVHLAK
jgi:hypothetical protein